jgi:hypothetical protein
VQETLEIDLESDIDESTLPHVMELIEEKVMELVMAKQE